MEQRLEVALRGRRIETADDEAAAVKATGDQDLIDWWISREVEPQEVSMRWAD
jgi:hypothetical protein